MITEKDILCLEELINLNTICNIRQPNPCSCGARGRNEMLKEITPLYLKLKLENEELKKQDEEYRIKIHEAFDYQDDLEQQLKSLRERTGNIPQLLHIFQDHTREDMKGVYYYIHDKDFMKLIQKLSEYIGGK